MPKIRPQCRVSGCPRMGRNEGGGKFTNYCRPHTKHKQKRQQSTGDAIRKEANKIGGYRGLSVRQMLKNS